MLVTRMTYNVALYRTIHGVDRKPSLVVSEKTEIRSTRHIYGRNATNKTYYYYCFTFCPVTCHFVFFVRH